MEIKKEKVQLYKTKKVKSGTKIVIKYVAEDGTEFNSEKSCRDYEMALEYHKKRQEIKKINLDFGMTDVTFYYAGSEEQLKIIEQMYPKRPHTHFYGELNVGEWIGVSCIDGGDYPDTWNVVTLSYLKQQLKTLEYLIDKK